MNQSYYFRNEAPTDHRNSWCVMVLHDVASWPDRVQRQRGCTHLRLRITRNMHPAEIAQLHPYRCSSTSYKDWSSFSK